MLGNINASFNAEYSYFEEERSSLDKRETLTVNDKSESSKDKVKGNSVVNANEISKRSLKNEHADQTEHFKQCEKNLNFVSLWGKPLGIELDYKWKKMNPRYVFCVLLESYTWYHILYTQYLHMGNNDFSKLFEVYALYGIGAAVILTTWVNYKNYKEIVALMHFTLKICRQNATGSRTHVLKARLIKIYNISVFLSCCGLSCVGLYAGYPMKAFLIDREYVSIMPIEIMFVDQSTLSGFIIANLIMSLMGLYTLLLLLFVNLSFFTTIFNYAVQVDMIEEDIKELNEYWNDTTGHPEGYQHILIRNICQKQQDMNSYINKITEVYNLYIFFFFVFSYASQVICMFEIITNDWISGYGIAIGVFICQMAYCWFGTIVSIQNDRLYNVLLEFKYYNSDVRSQKMYHLLLTSAMDFKELWIGPLAPLNVVTAIQIVKSMYTYYAVLMEFA